MIGHTLWVTPYDADERWPCGEFVVQSEQDRGLPVWTAQNRSIEDTDVVLWYVFGIHHITAPGGLAGDAGRHRLVLAQARRLLRPQPGARRARRRDHHCQPRGEKPDGHTPRSRSAQLRQRRVRRRRRRARRSTSSTRAPARPTPPRRCRARRTSTPRCSAAARAFEELARHDAQRAPARPAEDRRRDRVATPSELVEIESENTGKPKG